ncbi:DUF2958 domain-containing protein [Xenophilus azovorans]|uniref:DUF2958 domain-containing protein n=1 Tax=Xenophilus azovorans TaxID=151755 RepID=UPI0006924AB2|nr:DUF2958 domain-containing protein [Xenophilus azovorans]
MATTSTASLASSPFPFITDEQFELLLANGRMARHHEARGELFDPHPVVKLFVPGSGATWLLTFVDPGSPSMAFGLADLGFPEMGFVSLDELEEIRRGGEMPLEYDRGFRADKPLSHYARDARRAGRIVT